MDTETIISALVSSYNYKVEKYKKAQTKLSWKQEKWKTLNSKIYSLYQSVGNLRFSTAYNMKTAKVSDSTKATVTAGSNVPTGTQRLNVLAMAQAGYLTGGVVKDGTTGSTTLGDLGYGDIGDGTDGKITVTMGDGTTKDITVNKDTTVDEFVNSLKDAGLNASFDETNKRIYVSSKKTGEENDFKLTGDTNGLDALNKLGLQLDSTQSGYNSDAKKIEGTNAKIKLNGVEYESSSNNFSINGLQITAEGVTGDGEENAITITTDTDVQGIYDKIKDFLTQYNSLINEMNALYNAESSKGYEPLSSDERDAMSDSDIELWESKIKDSLLRRDDTLSSVMNIMTSAMSKGVEVGGKTYYLSSFGIKTLGYLNAAENQQYAYHIDGDEDDVASAGNADKLMAAIMNDPDTVTEFMQGLAKNLYDSINTKMGTSTLSSIYTVYNDKEMASEYSDYTSLIKKWEEKLTAQEDYWYNKFAQMEKALATLNNQTSALSSFFGS